MKRPSIGKFVPEEIDPFMCSHIIFAFAGIKKNILTPTEEYDEGRTGLYAKVTALKKKNPNLKVLIGVGGWAIGGKPFREMTSGLFRFVIVCSIHVVVISFSRKCLRFWTFQENDVRL